MSYCKEMGKDQVIFLTEEDASKPSAVELPSAPAAETPQGLITDSGEINWSCPCLVSFITYTQRNPEITSVVDNAKRPLRESVNNYIIKARSIFCPCMNAHVVLYQRLRLWYPCINHKTHFLKYCKVALFYLKMEIF
jgi:hypothetical protein